MADKKTTAENNQDNKQLTTLINKKSKAIAKTDPNTALSYMEAFASKSWETGMAYGIKKGRAFEKVELGKNMIKRGYTFEAVYELIGLNKEDIFHDP